MSQPTIKSNIWKIYTIQVLRWSMFLIPVIIPFYQANGLSMTQILLLQSFYSLIAVGMEIPFGYFADTVGLKKSIVIGCVLGFFGYAVYSLSYGFIGFLFGELLLGLGASFISGADSALVFETLLNQKQADEYKKIEGTKMFFESFSEGSASIIGGMLALISLRMPLFFEVFTNLLAIPLALSLTEPARAVARHAEGKFNAIIKTIKFSLHDHAQLKWLIIYSAIISGSTMTMVWFIQSYFQAVHLPLAMFGLIWALLQFSVALFAYRAHKIESMLGRKKALISLILLSTLAYLLLAGIKSLWGIGFVFIFYLVRGLNGPITQDYANRLILSENRATILSIKSLAARLIFSIVGPVVGWLVDAYSLQQALLAAGIIFFIPGLISLLFLKKYQAL